MKTISSITKQVCKKLNTKVIALLIVSSISFSAQAEELLDVLENARHDSYYLAINAQESETARKLFTQELKQQKPDWQPLNMLRLPLDSMLVLQEENTHKTGRGLYAIKMGGKAYLLQAPHSETDLYTGQIVAQLFSDYPFQAAAWNTVSRKQADMAHLSESYFQSFTQAFVESIPNGKVIQLHGFEQKKRKSADGQDADMIISAGIANPPDWVKKIAHCFKQSLSSYQIKLYPEDIQELGALTNAQNNLLQSLQYQSFLHIEMSKPLRETLANNAQLRQQFNMCLS